MGYLAAALFFRCYWRQSRDGFSAAFAAAFTLLALNQTLLAVLRMQVEEQSPLYLIRLAAFAIIIAGIVMRNRKRPRA